MTARKVDLTTAVQIGVDAWMEALPERAQNADAATLALMRHTIGQQLLPIVTALIEHFGLEAAE